MTVKEVPPFLCSLPPYQNNKIEDILNKQFCRSRCLWNHVQSFSSQGINICCTMSKESLSWLQKHNDLIPKSFLCNLIFFYFKKFWGRLERELSSSQGLGFEFQNVIHLGSYSLFQGLILCLKEMVILIEQFLGVCDRHFVYIISFLLFGFIFKHFLLHKNKAQTLFAYSNNLLFSLYVNSNTYILKARATTREGCKHKYLYFIDQ